MRPSRWRFRERRAMSIMICGKMRFASVLRFILAGFVFLTSAVKVQNRMSDT